jgi:hypothetical protein
MPFQGLYIVHTPDLIQTIQSKANAAIFVHNLLDFGMLFSGLNKESQLSASIQQQYKPSSYCSKKVGLFVVDSNEQFETFSMCKAVGLR